MPGFGRRGSWPISPACRCRSLPLGALGIQVDRRTAQTPSPVRCSLIWRPRWPVGRTASTCWPAPRRSRACRRSGRLHDHDVAAGRSTDRRRPSAGHPRRAASARAAAWAAGAAPAPGRWLHLDVDATITIDHSSIAGPAAATEEDLGTSLAAGVFGPPRTSPAGSAGRAAAGPATPVPTPPPTTSRCWCGRWDRLLAAYRPDPDDPARVKIRRVPSAGATHSSPTVCRTTGVGFSFGYACDARLRGPWWKSSTPPTAGHRRSRTRGGVRDGAWVAEATDLVDLGGWPAGTRSIR